MEIELRGFKKANGELMNAEQVAKCDKLIIVARDLCRLYDEKERAGRNILFTLQQDISAFQRSVLNATKFQLSDYQAFLWLLKRTNPNHKLLSSFDLLDISNQKQPSPSDSDLMNLNLPILSYSVKELCEISARLFEKNTFCQQNFQNKELIHNLVVQLSSQYNIVSYHNFTHAFSLQLLLHQITMLSSDFGTIFTPFELFFAGIAALAHDLSHKGTNSVYEINKHTELAAIYNNESVLENMHISNFFRLLREQPEIDIISKLQDQTLINKAKKLIITLILSTDMSKHASSLKVMTEKIKENKLDLSVAADKDLTLEMVFHGCDIGNPCFEYKEYLNWGVLLTHQFHDQTLSQAKQNLPVSQFLRFSDNKSFLKGQAGFIKMFSMPIWKEIAQILPDAIEMYQNVQRNLAILEK